MKFYCILFFLILHFNSTAEAGNNSSVNWMLIDTSNSNLPDNTITGITKDKNGDIWVSTNDGFAKFLGLNQWQVFHTPNVTLFDVCLAIESQDSIIWVATVNGLVRCCNGQVTIFAPYAPIFFDLYTCSLKAEGDNLWIGTYQYGLFKWDGVTLQNFNMANTGMPIGNVWSIDAEPSGKIWLCGVDATPGPTTIGAVVTYDNVNWTKYDTLNSGVGRNPYNISIDQFNNKWITVPDPKLIKYDNLNWFTFDTMNVSSQAKFNRCEVAFDQFGNKWASTRTGIAKYDDQSWTFYDTTNVPFPQIQSTYTIMTETNGNKFIGTYQGLLIFNENGIMLSSENNTLIEPGISLSGFFENKDFTSHLITQQIGDLTGIVSDELGRTVFSFKKKILSPGEYVETIDFAEIKTGVYFLTYLINNTKVSMKIVNVN